MKNILLFICCILNSTSYAQSGSLDSTFGIGGIVTTDFGDVDYDDYGISVALQSDGKIVVAGHSGFSPNLDFAIARYNSDGSLDNAFGCSGKITTAIGSVNDIGASIAIQNDGKIVMAGSSFISSTWYDFALVRYNTDGSLDNTFSLDGKVTTAIGSYTDQGRSVALQSDGKIVVAGSSSNSSTSPTYFSLARYNSNGTLDNSFGSGGKVTIGSSYGEGWSVAIQTDNKIVVAGDSYNGTDNDFALVRYNTDGSLDNTFSYDGKVITDFGTDAYHGRSVTFQSDGKILVAGYGGNYPNYDFALVRYTTDGTLDNTFSFDGKVTTDFGSSSKDIGFSVFPQTDGKIIMAGSSSYNSAWDFALVRYTTDGTLDSAFGLNGKVTTDLGSTDGGYSVAIQGDGKIVMTGYSTNGSGRDFAVVRYNSNCGTHTAFFQSAIICYGDSLIVGSNTYYASGTYIDTLKTKYGGCDSIITTQLTVLQPSKNSGDFFSIEEYQTNFSDCDSLFISANDVEEKSSIKIFPNPSSGIFTVHSSEPIASITITNIFGEIVFEIRPLLFGDMGHPQSIVEGRPLSIVEGGISIRLTQPKGIYFLEVVANREKEMKIMVLH